MKSTVNSLSIHTHNIAGHVMDLKTDSIFEWYTWPDTPLILLAIANTMDLPERMLISQITSTLICHDVGRVLCSFLCHHF